MNLLKNNVTLKQIIIAYLPSILWAIVIFTFSSQATLPGLEESVYDFIFKKLAHIFVYLILYILVAKGIAATINQKYKKTVIFLPVIVSLIYAVSDEFHQSLVPGRYATLRDIGYDMLGVTIAFLKKYNYI